MRQRIREKQTFANKASQDVTATHFKSSWSHIGFCFALMGSEESEMKIYLNIIYSDFTDGVSKKQCIFVSSLSSSITGE